MSYRIQFITVGFPERSFQSGLVWDFRCTLRPEDLIWSDFIVRALRLALAGGISEEDSVM